MTRPLIPLLVATSLFGTAFSAGAAPREAAINLSGDGPYYTLTLPVAVYPDALRPDLSDVRIVNAKGDLVPHAWTYIPETVPTTKSMGAPVFQIAAPGKGVSEEPSLQLRRRTDGTLVMAVARPARAGEVQQWIVDASRIDGALVQARFRLAAGSDGLFPFILEASDDLQHWRLVSADEQLAMISRQGVRIERLDVALGGLHAKYLRLRWRDPATTLEIEGVTLDSVSQSQPVPRQQWSAAIPAQTCDKDFCDYALPAGTPLDALRLQLAETNTLGNVQVLGLWNAADRPVYRHHNPLYALRHKHAEPPSTERQSLLGSFTAYRLKFPSGEVQAPDLPLDGGIYASLRLKTEGPINLLGNPPPTIAIGTTPRALVFLARGEGPFKLVWGKEQRDGEAIPLSTLIPKLPKGQTFAAAQAEVAIAPSAPAVAAVPAPAAKPEPASKVWLWAALGLGLLLLGGMAWSLFRSMGKKEQERPLE